MEDVITEAPPPSRFLEEELNNFSPPSPPPLLPISLHFPPSQSQTLPLKPSLLIIALSPPSLSLFHPNLVPPSTPLLASLSFPDNLPSPTLCPLTPNSLLLFVPSPVPSHHAYAVAKTLIGDQICPDSVLVFDSVAPSNYRGRLPYDEAVAFKLETAAERRRADGQGKLLEGLEYYPSGSVVDGLAAAILARCQVLNLKASLCVSWPEFDASVMSLIQGLLRNGVLRGVDLSFGSKVLRFGRKKGRGFESELYI